MEPITSAVATSNFSSSPGYQPPVPWGSRVLVPAVVLSLCCLLGVPGNIAVIILKAKWQHLSSLSQTLMLNLAMSDLLCLVTLPLWVYMFLYSWTFGLVACKVLAYLVNCSIYGSLLTVTMLAIQRYLQVVYLQRCLGERGQRRMLVVLWLVAIIMSIPTLVIQQLITDQYRTDCKSHYNSQAQRTAVLLTEFMAGFISVCVVTFAYICIHRKVNQAAFFNNSQTTRLVTSITVTFFVLWMPYLMLNVLHVVAIYQKIEGLLMFCMDNSNTAGSLTFVNSCLNPLLYAFASRKTGHVQKH